MAVPQFLHFMTNGDVYISTEQNDNAPGTLAGTFRINGQAPLTKITTVSGTNPYAVSGANGKGGREVGGR
jgi:hypothetical protein